MITLQIDEAFSNITSRYDYQERILNGTSVAFESSQVDIGPQSRARSNCRLTALYLPQFHKTEINNKNWGPGFTEWTNVTRAQPQYFGHVQPRLPRDLGFYDLSVRENIEAQIAMALAGGVSSFCFYYYWFGGRKVLSAPLEIFSEIENNQLEFCLCWANENWTRSWDGGSQEILIGQKHLFGTDKQFIHDVLPYLKLPNYQAVRGKKLIVIYRVGLLGNELARTLDYWRDVATKEGIGDLAIFASSAFLPQKKEAVDHLLADVDGIVQFPPHLCNQSVRLASNLMFTDSFAGRLIPYELAVQNLQAVYYGEKPVLRCVFPSWDNTPRRREQATIFINTAPAKFKQQLDEAVRYSRTRPENDGIVFINAWNEWAEGAVLEPCRWYGYAYLNACAGIVEGSGGA